MLFKPKLIPSPNYTNVKIKATNVTLNIYILQKGDGLFCQNSIVHITLHKKYISKLKP